MAINTDDSFDIDQNGMAIRDDDGNVLFYVTTGTGDPTGSSAPSNTWYFRQDNNLMYYKFNTGDNDWTQIKAADIKVDPSLQNEVNIQDVLAAAMSTEDNIVYVRQQGNDLTGLGSRQKPYATIGAAVVEASNRSPSSSNPILISVGAGQYNEDPFTLPDFVKLIGQGDSATSIVANNASADLINLGRETDVIAVRLSGVTGTGLGLLKLNNTTTNNWRIIVRDVQFSSSAAGLVAESTIVSTTISIQNPRFNALTEFGINLIDNMNATIFAPLAGSPNAVIGCCDGDSFLTTIGGRIISAAVGFEALGNGNITLNAVDISQIDGIPIRMLSTTARMNVQGCVYDESKIVLAQGTTYRGSVLSTEEDEEKLSINDQLSVGRPEIGSESNLGEGAPFVRGMLVYTFDGSTFVDVSDEAKSPTGSTFTFPNTSVNSAIYLSCDLFAEFNSEFYKIPGFESNSTQAAILGAGDIIFEYWNGSSWTEFNHMAAQDEIGHEIYANSKFEHAPTMAQYRFDTRIGVDWVANDPVSFGANRFWVRFRIDGSSVTQAPIFQQWKLHPSSISILSDGFQEFFGACRIKEKFPITFTGLAPVPGKNPNDVDVYLSDNLGIALVNNGFPSNQSRSAIFTQLIPFELDTSSQLDLTLVVIGESSSAGDAVFEVTWATSDGGDGIFTGTAGAPSTAANERTTTEVVSFAANDDNTQKTISIMLDIPEAKAQKADLTPESLVWVEITRLPANVLDDYNGQVNVVDLSLFYVAFREGGFVGRF